MLMTDTSRAAIQFILSWKSDGVCHQEHYFAPDVNMWRDIFPNELRKKLLGKRPGEEISHSFTADQIFLGNTENFVTIPLRYWRPATGEKPPPPPLPGRYYPQGFASGGLAGVFPQTLLPMRIVSVQGDTFTVDCNHPLSGRKIDITLKLKDIMPNRKERGGRCSDWLMDILENGPGMQARRQDCPMTLDRKKLRLRLDRQDDRIFYAAPRMVSHIDSQANAHLASVIATILPPGCRVLDLMASVDSHLPARHGLDVTGVGLNSEEMDANPDLARYAVHDLHADPVLPFSDGAFDAVLCSLSIEYLENPEDVIRETARVLKPAGFLLISFSNRWFPQKVTKLWTELHEFERMGLVLQLCWPHYCNLRTISYRNWPRPSSDKYFPDIPTSDPLYIIAGQARS